MLLTLRSFATILNVPSGYPTIQNAINNSMAGDTVSVSPGTYFENINFRGKNIVVTSHYYLSSDTSFIRTTILNGSQPVYADTGSVVIFNSGEDSTAVLQGFTITGGFGTRWTDVHGAGVYREGGGILIEFSAPTITHNNISNNLVTDLNGVISTGGGGLRIGDSNPVICSNFIGYNQARYGSGIVLNYTGAHITNNVIASNFGAADYYGGAGIWIVNNLPGSAKIIENNTIVDNEANLSTNGSGGVVVWSASSVTMKNNIIYNNLAPSGLQIKLASSTPSVTYCDVMGGFTGSGNFDADPLFEPGGNYLSPTSPCIDAGDSSTAYNDVEDLLNPGFALFPSKGMVRNDVGAYGGPCAAILQTVNNSLSLNDAYALYHFNLFPVPATSYIKLSSSSLIPEHTFYLIFDLAGKQIKSGMLPDSENEILIDLPELTSGHYFVRLQNGESLLTQKSFQIIR